MHRLLAAFLACSFGALGSSAALAQAADANPAAQPRPRIGLVLSGGGARGAAHLGVLKVLEELRVPVDFVAGTSMGAIVGGAYASGSTVVELEASLRNTSAAALFRDQPPRQDQNMRRKQDDLLPLFGAEIGLQNGAVSLPKGAVSGIVLESVLRRLVKEKGQSNFDRLPIPFRAVATDIETGQMVVFSEGDLAGVMRASMSVPGAVSPAEIGGRMLIDGGLVRNLPVDIARQMGADVVIAVNVGTPLLKREQITSVVGVSAQMLNILTEQNVQTSIASLKPDDILISPELGDFSAGDFDNLGLTVPIGEVAARLVADKLRRYSLPPAQYAALRRRQTLEALADNRPPDEIRFEGLSRVNPRVVEEVMDTKAGEPIDQHKLDRDIRRLYGLGDFEQVNYRLIDEGDKRVLAINAVEKSWGPDYLRFGLSLSSDFSGDSYFNLLATHRKTWINSLGAEWRNEVQVGRTTRFASEFYQPLDVRQYFFVAPHVDFEQRLLDVYQGQSRIARLSARTLRASLDLGSQFTKFGELRVGLTRGFADFSLDTGPTTFAPETTRFQLGGVSARLRIDQLDSVVFPRSGYGGTARIFASRDQLGAENSYTRWEGDFLGVQSYGLHSLQIGLKGGGKLGNNPLPGYDFFQWGGFLQQSGYRYGQLVGAELAFGRLVYVYKLVEQSLLEGAYAGVSLEVGKVAQGTNSLTATGVLKSGSLFLAFDSPLGPLYLAYGQAADGNRAAYLFLGRP